MKKPNLAAAILNAEPAAPESAPPTKRPPASTKADKGKDYRAGTVNVSAHLPEGFRRGLQMLKAMGRGDLDELQAEALNDLFVKHNLPTVLYEKARRTRG